MKSIKTNISNLLVVSTKSFVLWVFIVSSLLWWYMSVKAFSEGWYWWTVVNNWDTLTAGMWNWMLHRWQDVSTPWDSTNWFIIKSPWRGMTTNAFRIINNASNNPSIEMRQWDEGNAWMRLYDVNWISSAILASRPNPGGFLILKSPLGLDPATDTTINSNCWVNWAVVLWTAWSSLISCGWGHIVERAWWMIEWYTISQVDWNNNPSIELRWKTWWTGWSPYIDFLVSNNPAAWWTPTSRDDYDARIVYIDNWDKLVAETNKFEIWAKDSWLAQLCLNGSCTTTLGWSAWTDTEMTACIYSDYTRHNSIVMPWHKSADDCRNEIHWSWNPSIHWIRVHYYTVKWYVAWEVKSYNEPNTSGWWGGVTAWTIAWYCTPNGTNNWFEVIAPSVYWVQYTTTDWCGCQSWWTSKLIWTYFHVIWWWGGEWWVSDTTVTYDIYSCVKN